jgi:hypothetical protein
LVAGAVEWAASRVDVLRLHVMEGKRHAERLDARKRRDVESTASALPHLHVGDGSRSG